MAPIQKNFLGRISLVVLLLLLILGYWYINNQFSNAALSHLNISKMGLDSKSISRNIGDDVKDPFDQGIKALSNEDFNEAITFFKTVPDTSLTYTQARLYLSLAQFQKEDYSAVIQNAQIVIETSPNLLNKQKAEWLQLQAMLNKGDADDATFDSLLDKIAENEQHLLQAEAKDLKQSMNSFWRGLVF